MTDDLHSLHEIAASNRERINTLERETDRTRERVHSLESELAAVRFLGERIAGLGDDVKHLTEQVERVARRALERPTQGGLAVLAQFLAVVVAVVALVFAVTH